MYSSPAPILYEDNHLLAVNKQVGQIVQGDKTGDIPLSELFKDYIKQRDGKPGNVFLGVPHRLDRPVSGALLLAKTGKALERLNALIRERQLQKTYWAISRFAPPREQDCLEQYMFRNEKQNKSYICRASDPGAQKAELSYRLLARSERYFLLEVQLHTGRHHQIRAQLAAMGCPIQGDLKYGDKRSNPDGGISLHARSLHLIHPVRQTPLDLTAPVPEGALWQYFEKL
ncbi:MAG: RluA family pseudouridine synthase [Bacteroides sp.]|nr:RluA family pseudouridine synthase [Bacteroides sp.]MCM1084935.1 RluA family pseudouridine synthase [Bacteroides sp.]